MTQKVLNIVWLILLILSVSVTTLFFSKAINRTINRTINKSKITAGTVRDTLIVTQKDTIYKEVTKIVLQDIYKTITRVDTLRDSIVVVNFTDSIKCFAVEDTMPDKAYIKTEICSDSFINMPLDIRSYITYKPAPDSNKIIYRTDTLQAGNNFFKSNLFYLTAVVGFIAGAVLLGGK
jgi:hypothetical protein